MHVFKKVNVLLVFALVGAMTACASNQRTNVDVENNPEDLAAALPAPYRGTTSAPAATMPAQPRQPRQPAVSGTWPTRSGGGMNWANMAYPTGSARTSAVGIEKGVPQQVRLNQPFEYEIVVTNLTDLALNDVVVTDQPGDHLRIDGSNPAGTMAGGQYSWMIGDLGPHETKTIKVKAVATREGEVISCAGVSYNSLLCASIPVVEPRLALTKSGPAEVLKCDAIEYKFVVTNTGTGALSNVTVNDPLPNGLTTANGGSNITINVGELAAGQSRQYTSTVNATRTGSFTNKASAAGGGVTAASGTVNTVVRAPKLAITKTGPQRSFIGRTITYEIKVTNTGDGVAKDTVVMDPVPAGTEFVSASNGGSLQGGTVRWNAGTLQPQGMATMTMTVRSNSAGVVRNTASASAYCADDVSASTETTYAGIPAMLLEVIDVEDPDEVGTTDTYIITATNQGSANATSVTIVCTLEDSVEYVSSEGATSGSRVGNTVRFAPLATLAPKAKAEWRVVVRGVRAADARFRVVMTEDHLTRPVEETESTNFYE